MITAKIERFIKKLNKKPINLYKLIELMICGFDLFILSIEMQILLIGLFTTADPRKIHFLQSISQSNTNGWSKKYKTKSITTG
jgi:hypothetical protein